MLIIYQHRGEKYKNSTIIEQLKESQYRKINK